MSRADVSIVALAGALMAVALVLLAAPALVPAAPPAPTDQPTPRTTATPAPTPSSSVRVTSIPALLTALADDTVTEIVVADGTYRVSAAAAQRSDSLWIGARFAARTNPVTVRAETTGGVTFDGAGATYFGGITFVEGAHHQTWQGFRFTNGEPTGTGVIVFGGYSLRAPPHHITLRNITVSGLTGSLNGYPIYFSMAAAPGPHDLLIEDFTAVDNGASKALIHFYHDSAEGDPAGNYNAQNTVIRRATLTGTPEPIMIWARSVTNLLIEDTTISGAGQFAIHFEYGSGVVLRRVTSTGSGRGGFYSSKGANPPGVTFDRGRLLLVQGREPTGRHVRQREPPVTPRRPGCWCVPSSKRRLPRG
jgi:hypothetical protein